ncbi:hypothetical protein LTR70_010470 [Exophiala xenobiotica]|uniref:DUF7730 domain-containing protein n=1 Tax=Lithohypha guttulata TaxID=1690604 RepID=A0ABR0JUD1_9EURO|nr:hypothetical protein LTR24_010408 [Lithohypha guttulata]KAK5309236.1 hypothetical protein LTR70_010470 [Exophiala xenobiotica]
MLIFEKGSSIVQSAFRLNTMLSTMDDSVREYIFEQVRAAEMELSIQQAVSGQLQAELQADIYRDHQEGTTNSVLFQMLPPEIRHQIFAHVVSAGQSIHVFPPKGNETHGYRLSLCDESSYDFELGHCKCDEGRYRSNSVRSDFFNNALFLVSQTVRREALDAFFMTNKFTFTCLYELTRFTTKFKQSSSKIQRLRLFERVDDYPESDFRNKGVQNARRRLKALKHLELHLFISNWSAYETLYEDGLVIQMLHFALGPPPKETEEQGMHRQPAKKRDFAEFVADEQGSLIGSPHPSATRKALHSTFPIPPLKSFTPHIRLRSQYLTLRMNRTEDRKAEYYASLYKRLGDHLTDVFMDCGRKYASVDDVPKLMEKPKTKTREEDRALRGVEKRGILFMED